MLKRLTIHNYKAYVDFEIEFDAINLLLGDNGAGKSTIFDVLATLRDLIVAPSNEAKFAAVSTLFPHTTKTRWLDEPFQRFGLQFVEGEQIYEYQLVIEQLDDGTRTSAIIHAEQLFINDEPIVTFQDGIITFSQNEQEMSIPSDGSRAVLQVLSTWNDPSAINFRNLLQKLAVVRLSPFGVVSESNGETPHLAVDGTNFAAWYKYLSLDQKFIHDLTAELRNVIDGFSHFAFVQFGENHHQLRAYFADDWYRFHELSDGQKMLIVLYTLLMVATRKQTGFMLCIDEPENFVSLTEIQPWIDEVYDDCIDDQMQAIIISHHPNYIDNLAASVGIYLTRDGADKPVRIKPLKTDNVLPISVLMQRGRLDE